jgi:TPR repeat protein
MYTKGIGVTQDYAEAAAQGDADAQNDIGYMYENRWRRQEIL